MAAQRLQGSSDGEPKRASGGRKALVALLSLLVALGLAEVGLRYRAHLRDAQLAADLERGDGHRNAGPIKRHTPNSRLIFELKPGLDRDYKDVAIRTNSLGFRGREIELHKPPGVIRILGLGDSVMFGWGVPEQASFLAVLEGQLNAAYPEFTWEVINTGVPGYNTVQEVETLRAKGLALDPDIVLLNFVNNDLNLPILLHKKVNYWALDTLYLRTFALELRGLVAPKTDLFLPVECDATDFRIFEQNPDLVLPEYRGMVGWDSFERALDDLAQLQRSNAFEVVTLRLWWHQILRQMEKHGLERGFDAVCVIDLSQTKQTKGGGDWTIAEGLRLSASDPHPSIKMHRMTAQAILEQLVESGVIRRVLAKRG